MKRIILLTLTSILAFSLSTCSDTSTGSDTDDGENEPITYTISVEASPSDGGSVSPSGENDYEDGDVVDLQADPNDEYLFSGWSGDIESSDNPYSLTVDQSYSITANFELKTYELIVNTEGEGSVSEEVVQTKSYEHGTQVELTANPDDGWQFLEWQGDVVGSENPVQLAIDAPKEVTAFFEEVEDDFEPGIVAHYETSQNDDVEFYNGFVYLVANETLYKIDASDPDNLDYDDMSIPSTRDMHVANDLVYLAIGGPGEGEIWVRDKDLNIDDKYDSPHMSGSYPRAVYGSGDYIYVADYRAILQIIDHNLSEEVSTLGSDHTSSSDITAIENHVYIADDNLQVINVSDKNDPYEINNISFTDSYLKSLILKDQLLYVGGNDHLHVLDISVPADPDLLKTVSLPNTAMEIAIHEDRLYTAMRGAGMGIFDISVPENPQLLQIIGEEEARNFTDVAVSDDGRYVYITDYFEGFFIIQVAP